MNKHKLILLVFFFFSIGFLFAQERNFEEEIKHTEKQIQLLQASIKKNNEEIQKVTSKEKTTSQLLSIIGKNIKDSRNLITAYDKKLNLYSLQLINLQNAVDKNNKEIVTIKNNYKERSINIYKKKNYEKKKIEIRDNKFRELNNKEITINDIKGIDGKFTHLSHQELILLLSYFTSTNICQNTFVYKHLYCIYYMTT